jgi:hypothetical protein
MDLSYANITVFRGEHIRLYREAQLAYIISDEANPTNHPIFAVDTDLGSGILQIIDNILLKLVRHLLKIPQCGRCFLMGPLLKKVLVLEWYLFRNSINHIFVL